MGPPVSDPLAEANAPKTELNLSVYGREASAASWARLNFAAATICIALVIFRVFLTLSIRFFKSFRFGIAASP